MRATWPRIVEEEVSLRARYPHVVQTTAGEIHFRRSRWGHLNEGRDKPKIRHRESACWLRASDRSRIALLTLEEYDIEPGAYWDELHYWADGLTQQGGDVVLAMKEAWGGSFVSPSDYGTIVTLTGEWIAPEHRSRIEFNAALDGAMSAIAPDHAIALLLAYPAGFDENRAVETEPAVESLGDFGWRQRALMRLYQRELGFRPMRVMEARRECMWRPRADLADIVRGYLEPSD